MVVRVGLFPCRMNRMNSTQKRSLLNYLEITKWKAPKILRYHWIIALIIVTLRFKINVLRGRIWKRNQNQLKFIIWQWLRNYDHIRKTNVFVFILPLSIQIYSLFAVNSWQYNAIINHNSSMEKSFGKMLHEFLISILFIQCSESK